ncbi:MAG: flagellar biosynthesis protein FlhB [Nitrospinota bacterium]
MAQEEDKEQRTEDPTDKRREESFKKGRTVHSKEVSSTVVLMAALGVLYATGDSMRETMMELFNHTLGGSAALEVSVSTIRPILIYHLKMMAMILAPVMAVIMTAGVVGSLIQNGGFVLSLDPIKPKFSKLHPIKGFGRFFSRQSLMELLKSLFKVSVVGYICYWVISGEWEIIPSLSDMSPEQIVWFIGWVGLKLMFYVLLLMLALSAVDFAFQRFLFEEGLRMTKQEIKDERKESDGDPLVKQRIRTVQLQMARTRMMAEVPKAEVVITNPTHLAIALAYDRAEMDAPTVVAKGAGHIAERIKKIAAENDVPIMEDRPLARILFKSVEIGQMVPDELYRAIAEILAYVYRLKGKAL